MLWVKMVIAICETESDEVLILLAAIPGRPQAIWSDLRNDVCVILPVSRNRC